jgi:hypothetical protein
MAVSTTSTNEPSNAVIGDFWYDTVDAQLKVYNGVVWTVVAPAFTATQGKTGAFAENIVDTLLGNHIAVLIYQSNQIIAVFSNDNEFIPRTVISGFPSIKRGITLSNATGVKLHGISTNAELLNGFDGSEFIRNNVNNSATGTISLTNVQPLVLGANGQQQINVTTANTDFVKTNSGAIRFYLDNSKLAMQLNDNRQIVAEQGNANTPSITFNGDTDTGLHWVAPNTLGISANGTTRLTVGVTGATVNGTLTASVLAGNISATSGSINTLSALTLSTSTLTAPFITGGTTFSNNVIFLANITVDGNTTLGSASNDTLTINADTVSIPNGIEFVGGNILTNGNISAAGSISATGNILTDGNILSTGNVSAAGNIETGNNLFVNNELLVQFDSNSGIAALRADATGRILINVSGPTATSSNPGDMTLDDTAHVYAANTAKFWAVWKDGADPSDFEFLGAHRVDSITRESAAGEYRLNLTHSMPNNSFWAIVGMGARGNMNMLEFPIGGSFVRVKNELYDFTGTRESTYNSVVAHGI